MTPPRMTRRTLWLSSLSLAAIGAGALAATYGRREDAVRYGTVIGTLGALRTVLPSVEKKYGLKYDMKDFRDATSTLLALDQGELDVINTTSQHLVRAISEGIDVVWISGWGGGYNVLVARKGFDATDDAALTAAILARKQQGKPEKSRKRTKKIPLHLCPRWFRLRWDARRRVSPESGQHFWLRDNLLAVEWWRQYCKSTRDGG